MAHREFLQDNQIVKFTIESEHQREIEAWAQLVIKTGRDWNKRQPYCSLQDFRQINVMTPRLRKHGVEVNRYFESVDFVSINIAILLKKNRLTLLLGQKFLERDIKTKGINRRVFSTEEQALAWLNTCISTQQ